MKQEIRFCIIFGNTAIAYGTSGTGPPLVMYTNRLSHPEYDLNSPVWGLWVAELSKGYTISRYDPTWSQFPGKMMDLIWTAGGSMNLKLQGN